MSGGSQQAAGFRQGQAGFRRVLIVGGSMSGLLTGLELRARGFAVDVYERVAGELSGRGAGIVAQADLIARLERLGLDAGRLGVAVRTRQILDADGGVTDRFDCPQVLTAWERLYRLLRDAFPPAHYHRGRAVVAIEQHDDRVVARFADGGIETGDLLVGADGIRSTVRHLCDPAVTPLYAGYVAWRSLLPEQVFASAAHALLFERMTFCLPPGEQFLGYPVAGPGDDLRPGRRRYNVVWYRPADAEQALPGLLTDERGVTHAGVDSAAADPSRRGPGAAGGCTTAAGTPLAALIDQIEEPILQPIYDLVADRLAFGRVVLVGDAACVARPHVAAGVAKAADDAVMLADVLAAADDGPAGLRAFAAARLPINRRIVARARHLGAYLQATRTAEEASRSRRHGVPRAVMTETAVLDFLHEP